MENIKTRTIRDVRQSPEYGKYLEAIKWKNVKLRKSQQQVFVRRLGPVAVAKLQRIDHPPDWEELEKIVRQERVMEVIIEPAETIPEGEWKAILGKKGYSQNQWPMIAGRTLRVKLAGGWKEIEKQCKKDARYCIRQAEKLPDLSVEKNNWKKFYEVWKKSAKRKNLWIPREMEFAGLIKAFGANIFCITLQTSERDVETAAGVTVLTYQGRAYYYYAGATKAGTKANLPYLGVKLAMQEAIKRGCREWDFEGIFDNRWPNKSWRGFTHFKKSFGGNEILLPGAWNRWRWPF